MEQATAPVAIMLVIAACFLFSVLDSAAKWLVLAGLAAPFVAFTRFATAAILSAAFLRVWNNPAAFEIRSWPLQILRGVTLFGSTIFNFFALQTLQLGETISIFFAAPMVITALAGPVLGEWAGWRRWMAVIVGFAGVLVITRPGFGTTGIGYVYSLCSMFSYCVYVLLTRKLALTETPESMVIMSSFVPTVMLAPVGFVYGSMPASTLEFALILTTGIAGGLGHFLLIKAYKLAPATQLAVYPYTQIVWMVGAGWLVFSQFPDIWTFAGAAIIVSSGLYILHRERKLRLKPTPPQPYDTVDIAKKL